MRILGTGLSGTIGKFIAKEVIPLELDLSENKTSFLDLDFKYSDDLIHLGGIVGNTLVQENLRYSHNVNVRGTRFLAEIFKKKSSGKFVYISTSHVYAPSSSKVKEQDEIGPISLYGSQKFEAETILQEIFSSTPNRLLIIRIFSLLDWGGKSFTLSGGILELVKKNTSFNLLNTNDIRDFLTPSTVAQIVLMLTRNKKANGVINLCTGDGTRVLDAVVRMLSESSIDVPWINLKSGNSNVPVIIGDPSHLENLIGLKLLWTPNKYKIV
jgi:nucleoside-diphosphate-sugar epimerase